MLRDFGGCAVVELLASFFLFCLAPLLPSLAAPHGVTSNEERRRAAFLTFFFSSFLTFLSRAVSWETLHGMSVLRMTLNESANFPSANCV